MKTGPEETYIYEQLVQELSQQISDGVYAVGEKLPSIRKLRAQRRISVATAMQALSILDSLELFHMADSEGIQIALGQIFCPHASIKNRIRLSCGHPLNENIKAGIQRLGELVRKLQKAGLKAR